MNPSSHSPLGRSSTYSGHYDPTLLFSIPRADQRAAIGIDGAAPFFGADMWTAYELSWLGPRGRPQVAMVRLTIACETTHIVESKSLKLYLNSFNATRFADADTVCRHLREDIAGAVWRGSASPAGVGVQLITADRFDQQPMHELDGLDLDRLDIECDRYLPAPELLTAAFDEPPVTETLVSRLLKSNCLVTGQPDWASVQISYSGPQIDQETLLQYLVSFRNHPEFHEHCVERIFMDLRSRCRPLKLTVYARYTRRGGIDINPFRTSHPQALAPNVRTARQ